MKGKKTGGRKVGSTNKASTFSKEVINGTLSQYVASGQMKKDMAELSPKERVDAMIKLAAFVTPKPQTVDLNVSAARERTIEDTLEELSEEFSKPV